MWLFRYVILAVVAFTVVVAVVVVGVVVVVVVVVLALVLVVTVAVAVVELVRVMLDTPSQYMHYCLVLFCEVYCVIV